MTFFDHVNSSVGFMHVSYKENAQNKWVVLYRNGDWKTKKSQIGLSLLGCLKMHPSE